MAPVSSFSTWSKEIRRQLVNDVHISAAFDPDNPSHDAPKFLKTYKALWDTGATGTVISQKIVDEHNLQPIGMVKVSHTGGTSDTPSYLVNIGLPNRVGIAQLKVTKGVLVDIDVLIGMDVIGHGDFAVSNHGGRTVFTFRTPATGTLDFTGKGEPGTQPEKTTPKVGRNALCPCNSGKKYKKCCGR